VSATSPEPPKTVVVPKPDHDTWTTGALQQGVLIEMAIRP